MKLRIKKSFIIIAGIGIEYLHLDKIFQMFHQFDPDKKGSGLDLTIVKRILKKHSGSIRVEFKPQIRSKFIISLPAEKTNQDQETGHEDKGGKT
jgi:two-component system phosphate regulon sensor histidine kinase PhoR